MATKHGNRVYIQVLLEPFRGELFIKEAESQNIKPSALIRQLVYNYLAESISEEEYCDALTKDKQKWQDAIDARLEGRAQTRRSKLSQAIDASNEPI
jgi:DNA recombination-dependent growth factor C